MALLFDTQRGLRTIERRARAPWKDARCPAAFLTTTPDTPGDALRREHIMRKQTMLWAAAPAFSVSTLVPAVEVENDATAIDVFRGRPELAKFFHTA